MSIYEECTARSKLRMKAFVSKILLWSFETFKRLAQELQGTEVLGLLD